MTGYKDKKLKSVGGSIVFVPDKDYREKLNSYYGKIDLLSSPVGSVTSRDQIINPSSYIDPSMYDDSRAGRLQYEADLKAAEHYSEMQEAAYQEWYNSEAQQVARQRLAGLNPDLLGVEAGASADAETPSTIPGQNIPTGDQMALQTASTVLNGLGSIAGVFSGVAGIMGTISQIGLNSAQKKLTQNQSDLVSQQSDSVYLSNIGSFATQAGQAVTDRLAKAMQAKDFDIDAFYAGDFSDIPGTLAPSDDPRYSQAFERILKHSQKTHSDAYKQLAASEDGRKSYLSSLASSYYDEDDDEMVGQLEIIVHAEEELHSISVETQKEIENVIKEYVDKIDVEAAAAGFNDENDYKSEYYSSLNGQVQALLEQSLLKSESIIQGATSDVYGYLGRQFRSFKSLVNPERKQRIGWQILAGARMGWQDYLVASQQREWNLIVGEVAARINNLNVTGEAAERTSFANLLTGGANWKNAIINQLVAPVNAEANMTRAAADLLPW